MRINRRSLLETLRVGSFWAFLLSSITAGAWAAPAANPPLAIPTEAQRTKTIRLVREIYKSQYADRTAEGGKKLALTLLKDAAATQDDPVARYVMLSEAREIAGDAGEINVSLRAVVNLAGQFKVDSAELQLDSVRRVGRSAAGAKHSGEIAENCLSLAGIASYSKPSAAQTFCDLAEQAARAAKKPELVTAANAMAISLRGLAVEQRNGEVALARLKTNPEDKAANTAAGRYLCLVRGDWTKGLPLLAAGSGGIPGLREAAAKDITAPKDAADRMALAEMYWKLCESFEPALKPALASRAAHWYELAIPSLKGLSKLAAEKHAKEARAILASAASGPSASLNGHRYRRFDGNFTWHVAKGLCEQAGGRLIVIPDAEVQKLAVALADKHNTWTWIGATDEKEEGKWMWIDGTPMTYSHWHAPEPDNFGGAQNWAAIWSGDGGDGWSDTNEWATGGFICEWTD